jgi:hypothetical protein
MTSPLLIFFTKYVSTCVLCWWEERYEFMGFNFFVFNIIQPFEWSDLFVPKRKVSDDASLGRGVPWTSRTLDEPFLGRTVPWTSRILNEPYLGRGVPWTSRTLGEPYLGRAVPWTSRILDEPYLGRGIPWTSRTLDEPFGRAVPLTSLTLN